MSELTERSTTDQPLRRIAVLRTAVWSVVVVATAVQYGSSAPWAVRSAAFGLLYSAITATVPYPRSLRQARLVDLCVDLVSSLAVVNATGGASGPFTPLFFLVTLEAQSVVGLAGSLVVASACSVSALFPNGVISTSSSVAGAVLLGSLCAESVLLHRLGIPQAPRGTIFPARTVEDLEQLVETVEAQNRRLRQTQKELTSAVRQAQGGAEDAATRYRLLSSSLEETAVESAYQSVLELLRDQFGADAGAVWAVDYRGTKLDLRATAGPVSPVIHSDPIPLRPGAQPSDVRKLCEQKLRLAVPESQAPMVETPETSEILDPLARPDLIATALRAGDKIVGAVALASPRAQGFQDGDAARLAGLSTAAALAVQMVEQRTSLQRGIREISILHDMNLLVQNSADLDQIYEQIVGLVAKVIPFENCTIFRYHSDRKQLSPAATRGRQINLMEHVPFEHGAGLSAYVAGHRKQLFIADVTREPGLLKAELMPPRVRSFVSVPMLVRDNLIGVINVSHSKAGAFSQDEARVLNLLAGQAAMTIEREEMVRSLEQLAITDGLTGVFNHRYFQMRLENEVKRAHRYKLPFALLMIDLDHFKDINDRYGHAVGDVVLSHVAGLLRASVRETDLTARYGGEEFAVVLTQTSLPDAVLTAERLRNAVSELPVHTAEGVALQVTVSIGVAACPDHGDNREALLQASDKALYAAKSAGRNQVGTA
jgi:diguanylate cyclase (GGDEF)-like protein